MNNEFNKVKEFQVIANQPISEKPKMLDIERVNVRYRWMKEELDEFVAAKDLVEQTDAMIDLMYFALGTMVEMGVEPDSVFDIVHKANMSKLKNSRVLYDKNGKVRKSGNWHSPYHKIKREIYKNSK